MVTESTKWPDLPIRRASINSFGYGGANAHAILDSVDSILPGYRSSSQADAFSSVLGSPGWLKPNENGIMPHNLEPTSDYASDSSEEQASGHDGWDMHYSHRCQFILPFSAHDEKTLHKNFEVFRLHSSRWNMVDIAHTLSIGRSLFSHRGFAVATKGRSGISPELECLITNRKQGPFVPTLGFVFTGNLHVGLLAITALCST